MADCASTTVIVPAFNEEQSVGSLVSRLRESGAWRQILVIDDGSTDATAERAQAAGADVVRHPYNKGNGAAVKTGIRNATGDFILIIDGDGQHKAADAQRIIGQLGDYDLVIGARSSHTQATSARLVGNSALNWLASYMTGRKVPDLTSGFRGARTACMREFLHLIPNGFSTPTTTTLAFIKAGYSVAFEPIDAEARQGKSKIKLARDGVKFLLIVLKIVTLFAPMRVFLPVSLAAFVGGASYAAWTIATQSHIANTSVLLLMMSVLVFLVGLVSEQIAALRFERRE